MSYDIFSFPIHCLMISVLEFLYTSNILSDSTKSLQKIFCFMSFSSHELSNPL